MSVSVCAWKECSAQRRRSYQIKFHHFQSHAICPSACAFWPVAGLEGTRTSIIGSFTIQHGAHGKTSVHLKGRKNSTSGVLPYLRTRERERERERSLVRAREKEHESGGGRLCRRTHQPPPLTMLCAVETVSVGSTKNGSAKRPIVLSRH